MYRIKIHDIFSLLLQGWHIRGDIMLQGKNRDTLRWHVRFYEKVLLRRQNFIPSACCMKIQLVWICVMKQGNCSCRNTFMCTNPLRIHQSFRLLSLQHPSYMYARKGLPMFHVPRTLCVPTLQGLPRRHTVSCRYFVCRDYVTSLIEEFVGNKLNIRGAGMA